jgi:hypothetical protein
MWITQECLNNALYIQHGEGLIRFTEGDGRVLLYRMVEEDIARDWVKAEFIRVIKP